jgi:hypothetical protein
VGEVARWAYLFMQDSFLDGFGSHGSIPRTPVPMQFPVTMEYSKEAKSCNQGDCAEQAGLCPFSTQIRMPCNTVLRVEWHFQSPSARL